MDYRYSPYYPYVYRRGYRRPARPVPYRLIVPIIITTIMVLTLERNFSIRTVKFMEEGPATVAGYVGEISWDELIA